MSSKCAVNFGEDISKKIFVFFGGGGEGGKVNLNLKSLGRKFEIVKFSMLILGTIF